jgi:hypothetical protein
VHCDHEYLNFRGRKFSKSRGAVVDVPYFLSKYDPDPLRYYLTAVLAEKCHPCRDQPVPLSGDPFGRPKATGFTLLRPFPLLQG